MFGFGKKTPLYDQVRKSDLRVMIALLERGRERQHEDALALLIGYMVEDMASHMVKQGPPKNHGKAINADVFTFEVLAYSAHILQSATFALANRDYEEASDHVYQQFGSGFGMVIGTIDKRCGWQTKPVFVARLDEYRKRDSTGMNLFSTLMTVGDANVPMVFYERHMDLGLHPEFMARIAALTGLGETYGQTLLNAITEYDLDVRDDY